MLTITNKTKDAKELFNSVSNKEVATPEDINAALETYVTAIAEDAGTQVRAEYEELKNVTDNQILQARGIPVLTAEETKFYNEVSKAGGFDKDVTWPETIFERVFEDIQKEHPILRLVNFTPTVGLTKTIRSRRKGVAIFGPLHKDVEGQLDAEFGVEETTQIALTAFFLISNDTLQLGARWINRYVRLCLSEAVKDAWATKIITGTGNNEPIGLLKDLDGAVVSGVYPDKKAAGTLTFKDSSSMVQEFATLMKKMASYKRSIGDNDQNATDETRVVDGKIYLIINPVNYYDVVARLTIQNANGVYVTNMPFISPDHIIQSVDVPVEFNWTDNGIAVDDIVLVDVNGFILNDQTTKTDSLFVFNTHYIQSVDSPQSGSGSYKWARVNLTHSDNIWLSVIDKNDLINKVSNT